MALDVAAEADSLAPAVTRAAVILDLLAENGGAAAGPSELARRLGLPKSSIANICAALADAGLVAAGRDRLRPRAASWPSSAGRISPRSTRSRSSTTPATSCEPARRRPSSSPCSTALEMTYLARHDGRQPVRLTSQIGRRLPASVTATGKAALASLDDDERRAGGSTASSCRR